MEMVKSKSDMAMLTMYVLAGVLILLFVNTEARRQQLPMTDVMNTTDQYKTTNIL